MLDKLPEEINKMIETNNEMKTPHEDPNLKSDYEDDISKITKTLGGLSLLRREFSEIDEETTT